MREKIERQMKKRNRKGKKKKKERKEEKSFALAEIDVVFMELSAAFPQSQNSGGLGCGGRTLNENINGSDLIKISKRWRD